MFICGYVPIWVWLLLVGVCWWMRCWFVGLFASLGLLLLVGIWFIGGVCLGLLSLRFEYMLLHGVDGLFGDCFDLVAGVLGLL